jgi:hypothetical protein
MAKWKAYGKSGDALRRWSMAIGNCPELRVSYCQCVLESAAEEIDRLNAENTRLIVASKTLEFDLK